MGSPSPCLEQLQDVVTQLGRSVSCPTPLVQAQPLRPYQAWGHPKEDVATVTRDDSGDCRKQAQACGPEHHGGPGSGQGSLPRNAPPAGTEHWTQLLGGFQTRGKMDWVGGQMDARGAVY